MLEEEDTLKSLVQEAVTQVTMDLDHERDKRLAREISNEIGSLLKRMFG